MCQGCLSSGPLTVWSTIQHSTPNVKRLTPDCWDVGCRQSEPAVPVFMFIFRLLILPLIYPSREAARPVAEMQECLHISKSTHSDCSGPRPGPATTVALPIPHFFPSINHWQQKRKELRWGDPLGWSTGPGCRPVSLCTPDSSDQNQTKNTSSSASHAQELLAQLNS